MKESRAKKYKASADAYFAKNEEKIKEYRRDWHFKKKYGISLEDYDSKRVEQKHRCYICGTHEVETHRGHLCVDHDHDTGTVRKLLCSKCNQGLGLFNDSPELLDKAANYLKEHGKP